MSPSSTDMLQQALTAHQAGRLAEAEQGYRTVLARHATNADAAYLLGLAVQQQGRAAEALVLLQRAVALADQRADFFNSLGEAHRALGQLPDAMAAFRAAIARRPAYVDAQLNLATTLQQAGRLEEALIMLFEAVAAHPHEGALRARLALLLNGVSLGSGNPLVRSVLLTLCHDPAISAQSLSGAMLGLVKGTPACAALQAAVNRDADLLVVARDALNALAHDDLLLAALPRLVVTDPEVELVLTRVRKALLLAPADESSALTAFIGAIAVQAYNTEYGWAIDADEQLALELLRAEVDAASAALPIPASCESAMLRGAMYATVRQFAAWSTLDDGGSPSWSPGLRALVRDQVAEYRAERAIADALPTWTPLAKGVSSMVRTMYEENPYPRWVTLQHPTVTSIPAFVRALHPADASSPSGRRILVAGGGSGQQPLQMALSFPDAQVWSLDLSRSSLAYAARMAAHHRVANVQFGQGDILNIDESLGSFAIVSCSGVLHHLAEPLSGWRRLLRVLEPHGVMKIGLYATAARRQIDAARALVKQLGFPATDEGIRACRQAILALPMAHPARGVLGFVDFFSTSGCRDLLMHVQERSYTLPEIARDLETLQLRFLGFQVPATVQARFHAEYPGRWLDLSAWDAFETAHPDTFAAMYQFWCSPA
jgi:tetratricopeptide (TPR) repeat protein/SAM-dependent methyltransferase